MQLRPKTSHDKTKGHLAYFSNGHLFKNHGPARATSFNFSPLSGARIAFYKKHASFSFRDDAPGTVRIESERIGDRHQELLGSQRVFDRFSADGARIRLVRSIPAHDRGAGIGHRQLHQKPKLLVRCLENEDR